MEDITLAYGYGWRNAGDMAINLGSTNLLNSYDDSICPTIISIHPGNTSEFAKSNEKFENHDILYNFEGGPISYDPQNQTKLEQYSHLARNSTTYLTDIAGLEKSKMAKKIKKSDFLLYNGGNLIHNKRGLAYLLGVLYPLQLANRYNTPYGILPHTIFGLDGRYSNHIDSILNNAEFIWTREKRSHQYLKDRDNIRTEINSGLDTAFFSTDVAMEANNNNKTGGGVAFVPRFTTLGAEGYIKGEEEKIMEKYISRSLEQLKSTYESVTFVVQTKFEEEWAKSNKEFLDEVGISIFKSYDEKSLRNFYRGVDVLLTMRLHAGIFALSVGTPAIGIYWEEWGPKIPGTWETIGINDYVLSWKESDVEDLLNLTDDVLRNRNTIQESIVAGVNDKKSYMKQSIGEHLNRS